MVTKKSRGRGAVTGKQHGKEQQQYLFTAAGCCGWSAATARGTLCWWPEGGARARGQGGLMPWAPGPRVRLVPRHQQQVHPAPPCGACGVSWVHVLGGQPHMCWGNHTCAGWATTHVLGQPHTPVQNPGSPGRNLSLRLHAKQSPTLCMPTLYCLSTVAPVLSVPSMLHILMVPSSDPDAYESYVGANRTACTGPWWPLLTSSSCPVS